MLDDHGWSWMIFFVGGETWKHWIFSRGRGSGRSMTGSNGQVLHWDQPGPIESSIMELFFSNFCSVLFCSVLFCSVLWRSMMTLHMTFFFSPSLPSDWPHWSDTKSNHWSKAQCGSQLWGTCRRSCSLPADHWSHYNLKNIPVISYLDPTWPFQRKKSYQTTWHKKATLSVQS